MTKGQKVEAPVTQVAMEDAEHEAGDATVTIATLAEAPIKVLGTRASVKKSPAMFR